MMVIQSQGSIRGLPMGDERDETRGESRARSGIALDGEAVCNQIPLGREVSAPSAAEVLKI